MAAGLQLSTGAVFGRDFRVLSKLASGGMGTVYLAEQLSTGKQRALKVMHAQYEGDGRARQRFIQEARVGASIDSDHIVETVAAGVDDETGMPFIAMELLKGQDLKGLLAERGALDVPDVLEILRQLCHGLGAAHAIGLVHRDLKPENVFLARSRREGAAFTVKILDFGIAKLLSDTSQASNHTQQLGSPRWMAPEQAERGGEIRPSTDVWALGLIAFQLLTGKVYWKTANTPAPSVMQQMCEILMDPLEPASARAAVLGVPDRVPPGFDGWFVRCVQRDNDLRFTDATEAIGYLLPVLEPFADVTPATGRPRTTRALAPPVQPTSAYPPVAADPRRPSNAPQRPVTPSGVPSLRAPQLPREVPGAKIPSGRFSTPQAPSEGDAGNYSLEPPASPLGPPPGLRMPTPVRTPLSVVRAPTPARGNPAQPVVSAVQQHPVSGRHAAVSVAPATTPVGDGTYTLDLHEAPAAAPTGPEASSVRPRASVSSAPPSRGLLYAVVGFLGVLLVAGGVVAALKFTSSPGATSLPDAGAPPAPLAVPVVDAAAAPEAAVAVAPEAADVGTTMVVPTDPAQPSSPGHSGSRPSTVGGPRPERTDAGVAAPQATTGTASQGDLERVIRSHHVDIIACHERASNPDVAGRLTLLYRVEAGGRAGIISTSGLDAAPEVVRCVTDVMRSLDFPIPAGGSSAVFSVSFTFSRSAPPPAPPSTPPPTPPTPPANPPANPPATAPDPPSRSGSSGGSDGG